MECQWGCNNKIKKAILSNGKEYITQFFTTSNDGGVPYSLAWVFVNIPYQQYDANNNLSPLGCQKSDSCFLNVSDLNCPPTNETK